MHDRLCAVGLGEIVLFGGLDPSGFALNDTWVWDGVDWTAVYPGSAPLPRHRPSMVFDAARSVLVMHGGLLTLPFLVSHRDTWTWDGIDWLEVATTGPTFRWQQAMT